ncbi:MAG: DNA-binding response regulator [Phyllobacteriaceae bacterium]|jgi:two-component system alkaline phosphatase synthesis response regulator PhoP|nr:DNA-binding response regulator [Phyllobacteriaceae bacterium]
MSDTKILVVDDEPDILEILTYNLKKEGYTVFTAKDGKEGLELARKELPQLIILDIMMPELDGVEVCRILRSEDQFDNTVIAFLTARDEDYSQIAALDVGGDDYITKPIKPRVLLSRVKALLRRAGNLAGEKETILSAGDITVNKERVQVFRKGEEVTLAKKEFELLCLLLEKPGKVFTREEIFSKVWGADVIVGNRTIDVHIRKLREKLGDKYIKTIKGIGYRFEF